jgi:hypothetical protein
MIVEISAEEAEINEEIRSALATLNPAARLRSLGTAF